MTMTSSSSSSTSLAPGFRFHPTDEELVRYYLRRKICGKLLRFDAISDIDVYKVEPWDLPDKSRLKSKDMEWYFFSGLDKKYGNSSRTNRATEKGYWKTTGKDRPVYHRSQVAGMKKTLVYHEGRAPSGKRTNWVMHEYRLSDESLTKAGIVQDAFVLCRIFQKSGAGPKNGAQYGAPLVEEEWENDDLEMTINMNGMMQIENGANSYLDELDLEQILGADVPPVEAPLLLEHSHGSNETIVENNSPVLTNGQQMDNANNYYVPPHQPENPILYETETGQVKPEEHLSDSTKSLGEAEFLFDDTFWDAAENLQYDNGAFLETNDMLNPLDDAANFDFDNMIDNYLSFHDSIDENLQYLASDPPIMLPNSEFPSRVEFFSAKDENEQDISNYGAPSSKQEPMKYVSETKYPFIKKASNMLGSIPAPHAFAAEYPTKKAALLLDSISQASSSVRVTAGLIERRGRDYNIFLSVGITPGKSMFKGWCYFTFLCVAVFSMSFKFGSLICTR